LGNVDSVSRTGDKVVITNRESITIKNIAHLDKTISFTVASVNGKPALQNIQGVQLGVNLGFKFVVVDTPTHWGP
jgi:hypothetical protein